MKGQVEAAVKDAAKDLARMVSAKTKEIAREKLKSRYKMYVDGLSVKEVEGAYLVSLSSKVRFIEDGQQPHNMLDSLLASKKAKTAKDGSRYLTVPFEHGPGKGPTSQGGQSGEAQQDLVATIKNEMKRQNKGRKAKGQSPISFGKIEKNADGSPMLGKLHSFDISNAPLKTREGPGMGHGAIGDVRQGVGGIPHLQGVSIYQTPDATSKTGVKRSIMTFRTASSKHSSPRWDHPGTEPLNMMEDALEWARATWENEISPEIVERILVEISG